MPDTIKAGERRELRTVVRAQMRALRSEVTQRQTEMMADVETRVALRYREDSNRLSELSRRIKELTADCNVRLAGLIEQYADVVHQERYGTYSSPYINRRETDKDRLRKALVAGVAAQACRASGRIDRLEADLLRDLAMDALHTEAALAFVETIPTITDLMPSRQLTEIEAQFEQEEQTNKA